MSSPHPILSIFLLFRKIPETNSQSAHDPSLIFFLFSMISNKLTHSPQLITNLEMFTYFCLFSSSFFTIFYNIWPTSNPSAWISVSPLRDFLETNSYSHIGINVNLCSLFFSSQRFRSVSLNSVQGRGCLLSKLVLMSLWPQFNFLTFTCVICSKDKGLPIPTFNFLFPNFA